MDINPTKLFASFRYPAFLISSLWFSGPALANDLQVIELFTSQGCYSCPAADKLIGELAAQDDGILNLEFHVDYWNRLQYRGEGNWEDPYSSAQYTERQRRYSALKLRGNNGVYTPQAVVNGVYGLVGSNRKALNKVLNKRSTMPIAVSINRENDSSLAVSIEGESTIDATLYMVHFLKRTETEITSGENHDKVMVNHNVVTEMTPIAQLAELGTEPVQVAFSGGENRGCAILVQPAQQGPIIGAARCP